MLGRIKKIPENIAAYMVGKFNIKTKNESINIIFVLMTGIIIILGLLLFLFIKNLHIWPLMMLIIAWSIILTKYRNRYSITAAFFVTLFYLVTTNTWIAVAASQTAPEGHKMMVFNAWISDPLVAGKFMLTGYGGNEMAGEVRDNWQMHQLWMVPMFFLAYRLVEYKLKNQDKNKETLHGSAKFEEPADVRLMGHQEGLLVGKTKEGNKDVIIPLKEAFEHTLIDGAPGAGKSTAFFIPNLLRIAQGGGYANLVITDPKMELLSVCGPEFLEAGYKVLIYHPYFPEISDAWNMLYYADDWESVDDMVMSIINNTNAGGKIDPYWEQQSNTLLSMVCYHLRVVLDEKANMNHVQAMAGVAKPEDIEVTLKNSQNLKIKANANGFFSKVGSNDKVISSVMGDLPRRLKLWTIDPVRATTSVNEINFADLCSDQKVALFIVTPMDKKEQLRPLFSTFFGQLFKIVQEKGRELGKLPRPLLFFFEEFANLGTIPNFDGFLTMVRGYLVGVIMGIQSLSQLEELYGRNRADTIINACANYIISPRIGVDDAKYFSSMLGNTTVLTTERIYNKEIYTRLKHKYKEQATKRALLNPDEIRALNKENDIIVVAGNRRPVLIKPALYYKDNRWAQLGMECYDSVSQQNRRKVFLRENRNLPALLIPSEEEMMFEAALATAPGQVKEKQIKSVKRGAIKVELDGGEEKSDEAPLKTGRKIKFLLPEDEMVDEAQFIGETNNEVESDNKFELSMNNIVIEKKPKDIIKKGNPFNSGQ